MNFTIILANSQNSKLCWDLYGKCIQFESDGENLDVVTVSLPPLQGLACLLRVWPELVAFRAQNRVASWVISRSPTVLVLCVPAPGACSSPRGSKPEAELRLVTEAHGMSAQQ